MLRKNFVNLVFIIFTLPCLLIANESSVRKIKDAEAGYAIPAVIDSANMYIGCFNAKTIRVINKITESQTTVSTPGILYHLGLKGKQLELFSVNDQMTGFMVSGSTDYGNTWEKQQTNQFYSAYSCIYKNNDSALFFGGDIYNNGSIMATYDNSQSFTLVFENPTLFCHSVNPQGELIYFADNSGNLFRSEDFCKTNIADTTICASKTGSINALKYINNNLFVVLPKTLYICNGNNSDWSTIDVPDISGYSLCSISSDTSGNYYLVMTNDNSGRVLRSRDLINWSVFCDVPSVINDFFMFSATKFAITGIQGDVWIAEPVSSIDENEKDNNWTIACSGKNINICFNDDKDHSSDNATIVDLSGNEVPLMITSASRNTVCISTANQLNSGAYIINMSSVGYKKSNKITISK